MSQRPARHRFAELLSLIFLVLALAAAGCGDNEVGKAESVAAVAGADGGPGFFDGSSSDPVRFDSPSGVAVTTTGDRFVADTENHVIRKIDAAGRVTTFAGKFGVSGTLDGTGANARFSRIAAITAVGTFLYVCDNNAIRSVNSSGVVTTVAGIADQPGMVNGSGLLARFRSPRGIVSNGATAGTILFVADTGNHMIRRVIAATGETSPVAGSGSSGSENGLGASASFSSPEGVALIGTTLLYVADTGNHTIRKVVLTASLGDVTLLAGVPGTPGSGDTVPGPAQFRSPGGIATDGSVLFVADTGNSTIRQVDQSGVVTTPAGLALNTGSADGTGSNARFNAPKGIGTLSSGGSSVFYVADTGNSTIRQVDQSGVVTTVAGNPPHPDRTDGTGSSARFRSPGGIAVLGGDLFLADTGNHSIRKVTSGGVVTTLAGLSGNPPPAGSADGSGSSAGFRSPEGIAPLGGDLYVADTGNHTIRKVTTGGVVTTLAGSAGATGSANGTGTAARFSSPKGIASDGTALYVVDSGNNAIRKVTTGGEVTTLAGSVGRFDDPRGIAFLNGALYVADAGDHTIRKVLLPSGAVSDFAGSEGNAGFEDKTGDEARFSAPTGIAGVDSFLYVADTGNHAVRRISTSGKVTTFAGDPGAATTRNGDPSVALMNAPTGIAGESGTIYFTDADENVVRKILF